jgi:hypothetical protein
MSIYDNTPETEIVTKYINMNDIIPEVNSLY